VERYGRAVNTMEPGRVWMRRLILRMRNDNPSEEMTHNILRLIRLLTRRAKLSQRDRAMLYVIDHFAKSLKVTQIIQNDTLK